MSRKYDYYKDLFGKAFTVSVLLIGATVSSLKTEGINFWNILGAILSVTGMAISYKLNLRYKLLAEDSDD